MDKLEIKKGNSVKFADLIDDGKKNDNTIYYVTDEKKIHLADMVLEDTENVKEELMNEIDTKHEKLVSGQNIKTIARESVLGSGNIVITPQTAFTVDNRVLSVAEHDGFY